MIRIPILKGLSPGRKSIFFLLITLIAIIAGCSSSVTYLQEYQGYTTHPRSSILIKDLKSRSGRIGLSGCFNPVRNASLTCGPSYDYANLAFDDSRKNTSLLYPIAEVSGFLTYNLKSIVLSLDGATAFSMARHDFNATAGLGYSRTNRFLGFYTGLFAGVGSLRNQSVVIIEQNETSVGFTPGKVPFPGFYSSEYTSESVRDYIDIVPIFGAQATFNTLREYFGLQYFVQNQITFQHCLTQLDIEINTTGFTGNLGVYKNFGPFTIASGIRVTMATNIGSDSDLGVSFSGSPLAGFFVQTFLNW